MGLDTSYKKKQQIRPKLIEIVAKEFQIENIEDVASLHRNLATQTKETGEIGSVVEKLQEAINLS